MTSVFLLHRVDSFFYESLGSTNLQSTYFSDGHGATGTKEMVIKSDFPVIPVIPVKPSKEEYP